MIRAVRLSFLVVCLQACAIVPKRWRAAIDHSPCFVYLDTPLPAGAAAAPGRSYIRLRNRRADLPGKSLEVYGDSALTQRRRSGIWESAGRDTLRLDFWSAPTTILIVQRQSSDRWAGRLTYGGDLIVNGKALIWHSQVELIPYRCPAPA